MTDMGSLNGTFLGGIRVRDADLPRPKCELRLGASMLEVGAAPSVDLAAGTSPDCRVAGWASMSASRFTVACCMRASGAALPRSWLLSRPQDHCTVPELNTSAPLAAWR